MRDKVLTIDLKNRTFGTSIIIDTTSIEGNDNIKLDLDLNGALQNIKNAIRDGYIEESEKTLKGIEAFFQCHREHELYDEYCNLKMISNNMMNILNCLKSKIGLEEYLDIKDTYNSLNKFKEHNDISYFEYTYNNVLSKVQGFLNECNLNEIIKRVKDNIKNTENISYTSYIIDKIKESDVCEEEEVRILNEFKELKDELNDFRIKTLNKYNNKLGTVSNIKALLPYEYRDILKDNNFKIYMSTLSDTYEKYDMLREDFSIIYKLYKLNNSKDYHNFYKNLIDLSVRDFENLNDYYREYVVRKIYKRDKKYYTTDAITKAIQDIVDTLSVKDNASVLYL